jgi:hypothetical protein
MRPVRLTALLGFALAAACQPASPARLSDADKAAIDSTSRVFVGHVLAGDFAALVRGYYSDDAIVLPPNAPAVTGHGAIEAMFKTFPRSRPLSSKPRRWRAARTWCMSGAATP